MLRVQICIAIDGATMEITYHFLLEFPNCMMSHSKFSLETFFLFSGVKLNKNKDSTASSKMKLS